MKRKMVLIFVLATLAVISGCERRERPVPDIAPQVADAASCTTQARNNEPEPQPPVHNAEPDAQDSHQEAEPPPGITIETVNSAGVRSWTVIQETEDRRSFRVRGSQFANRGLTGVTIPYGLTHIGLRAFANNQLTEVLIPASVIYIEAGAFDNSVVLTFEEGGHLFGFGDMIARLIDDGNAVEITGYMGDDTEVIIPPTIRGLPVRSIGSLAFAAAIGGQREFFSVRSHRLTSVVIPDSVTRIGDWAFAGNNLGDFTIPDSVTSMGAYAFWASGLTSVAIPNNLANIERGTFMGNMLTSIIIPNSVTGIGWAAFFANGLTSVTIPGNVRHIGGESFAHNPITSLTIQYGVIQIGISAFRQNQITAVDIPNSVTQIAVRAFDSGVAFTRPVPLTMPNRVRHEEPPGEVFFARITDDGDGMEITWHEGTIRELQIPSTIQDLPVTAIGEEAFSTSHITHIIIPDGVKRIGNFAFDNSRLAGVTIPYSVTHIGTGAFLFSQLTDVVIPNRGALVNAYAFDPGVAITIGEE